MTRWKRGGVTVVSLFREKGDETAQAVVELPAAARVYDIRRRKDLGRTRRFATRIVPGRAAFFAVLPSPGRIRLELEKDAARRGEVVQAQVRVEGVSAPHPLHLRASAGKTDLEWLTRNIVAGAEAVRFPIPLAYNDPVGTYRIEVTDLFTGRTAVAGLTVR